MNRLTLFMFVVTATFASSSLRAENVQVSEPWVRATAPGQKVAGGFMSLTADEDMVLVGGSSPVSKLVELHDMKMDKGVMEMRQVSEIALPKGRVVSLEPGGLHVMFIGLVGQIKAGDAVPIRLVVKSRNGKEQTLNVTAIARKASGHHH